MLAHREAVPAKGTGEVAGSAPRWWKGTELSGKRVRKEESASRSEERGSWNTKRRN